MIWAARNEPKLILGAVSGLLAKGIGGGGLGKGPAAQSSETLVDTVPSCG